MYTICLDARMLSSGGIGTYIRNLIPFIGEAFHLQLLVNLRQMASVSLARYEKILVKAPIYSIQEQMVLPLSIPRCDLFWSPHYNIPLLPIRAKKRVVTIHDVYHLAFAASLNVLEKAYAKIVMRSAIATASRVITVSAFSAKELMKYTQIAPAKLAVIHSGIEGHLFNAVKSQSSMRRYFLFVGNFKPHKNLKGILEAFRLFLMQEQADLLLVGKRKGMRTQEDLESLLGPTLKERVQILEDVTDEQLPSLYANAEALLFPSFYEGFGFPPLEALACGCPVIVSDIAVLREVCKEATRFVNPFDPKEIKDSMLEIWQEKNLLKQQAGKDWAFSFSWKKSAQQHVELFESVCKGR